MTKHERRHAWHALFFVLAVTSSQPSSAEGRMPEDIDALSYFVVNQPIVDFFEQMERDSGVQIDTTESVRDVVRTLRLSGDVEQILTTLARRFDLEWFGFNGVYYVSAETESRMRLIRLGDVPVEVAKDALAQSGLTSDRFSISQAAQGTALALTGPPKLLGLSEAVIESVVVETEAAPINGIIVRHGLDISIETHELRDIAARIEARGAVPPSESADVPAEGGN
ncbi:MAG: hypothetical protein AAFP85_11780 [Pseudomonadota bacterium]